MQSKTILNYFKEPKYNTREYEFIDGYGDRRRPGSYLSYNPIRCRVAPFSSEVIQKLNEEKNKHAAIAARDEFKQNCFHLTLSGKLFSPTEEQKKYHLVEPDIFDVPVENRPYPAQVSDLKQHIDAQNNSLHTVVEALLAPFEQKEGVNNLAQDQALFEILLAQDLDGNTPLHLAFQNLTNITQFQALLTRIQKMNAKYNEQDKINLAVAENKKQENILHELCWRWRQQDLQRFLEVFGRAAVIQAASRQDCFGNTPVHYYVIRLANVGDRAQGLRILLGAKEPLVSPETLLLQSINGLNVIHASCLRKSSDLDDDYNALDVLCTFLEKDVKENEPGERKQVYHYKQEAVTAVTKNGCNALHIACQSGDPRRVERILRGLTLECQRDLARAKTKEGFTALHFACRYGNRTMLKSIVNVLGQEETFRIARVESGTQLAFSTTQLAFLVSQNNQLSPADYESVLSAKLCLMDGYHYLVNRSNEWNLTATRRHDLADRGNDFKACITRLNQGQKVLPNKRFDSQSYWCFFKSTERYQQTKNHFASASQETAREFMEFIGRQDGEVARKLTRN